MHRYAQINADGIVVSDSHLSGEVVADNMIAIADDFDLTGKKYVNGEWVAYTPPTVVAQVTDMEQAIYQAQADAEYLICLNEINS